MHSSIHPRAAAIRCGSHHSRPGHEQSDSRGFRYAYFAGLRHRRRTFWLHRRSHWTETALMLSILTYSICSFASGLATSVAMLAGFRFILGLGMGGEWNTGATLVPKPAPPSCAPKRSPLCRVPGQSATRSRPWWQELYCTMRTGE